ncbi:hypothetical protein FRACYDRAFT_250630 [Fragilariopsis cylindrus CCMP1102]|uniref:Uncharacterized protein n=1 Tax=Fragilariopsis cylindrus CCMP1102 TaxID=635003 RepID=A0A1E7EQ84_9STRA|nr:hypothetical protein FRACYDRAFT_250630 [Fragilariopsis cylindrus CCMP1102]|eukprot:OEU07956.1 hypothetical protein FRACYDRAFT_250630 [Fragilariopsis cylindrus CCMP1102]
MCYYSETTIKPIQRHCSDPIVIDDESNRSISDNNVTGCNDSMQPYMRMMKNKTFNQLNGGLSSIQSYVCCDTIIDDYNDNGATNFSNSTECVPNHLGYVEAYALNFYASLRPISCENDEMGSDFQYPKYIDGSTYYKCCKTQHKGTKSFVQDAAFYATVIMYDLDYRFVQVPLVAHLKEPSKNNYSSYTLYLVYLAIPDLALNFYILVMYSSYVNQVYDVYFNGVIINLQWRTSIANTLEGSFIVGASLTLYCLKCI